MALLVQVRGLSRAKKILNSSLPFGQAARNFACTGQVISYYFFTYLPDDLPGPLPIMQARMKSFLQAKQERKVTCPG